jgi:hypothetical protein
MVTTRLGNPEVVVVVRSYIWKGRNLKRVYILLKLVEVVMDKELFQEMGESV